MKVLVAESFYSDFALFETEDPNGLNHYARLYTLGQEVDCDPETYKMIGCQDTMTAEEAMEEADQVIYLSELAEELEKAEPEMKSYLLTCSKDGTDINYVELIERREEEPGFWECCEIAERAGCEFFTLEEFEY